METTSDVVGRFFAISEKAIKEGGGDDLPTSGVVNEEWRHPQWIHPYAIFKSFASGLIDTEEWEPCISDSFVEVLAFVKSKVSEKYPSVCKITLLEISRDMKEWARSEQMADKDVDFELVIENALISLKAHLDATNEKVAAFLECDEEEEDATKRAS